MSNIIKTNYCVNEVLCEKSIEQAIDCEINLPDYCGDISRILECFAFPNISASSLSANKISIEGNTLVRLLYISDGEIFSYEQNCPFSIKSDISCDSVGAVLDISTTLQYLNCRAASSRKAEAHGAFVIKAKVLSCSKKEVINNIEDDNMQIKKDIITACSASGNACVNVSVEQVADIGNNKPNIKSIIRNTAFADINETKQVAGKILVKGELTIKTLYKSEEDTLETIENILPFSQILNVEGVSEESVADIKSDIISLDITVKPSALGTMTLMDISAVIMLCVCSYNCIDFPALKDAYSTVFDSECSFKDVNVDRIVGSISETFIHTFEIPALNINKAIDVWCDDINCNTSFDNSQLNFTGTLSSFALFEDKDGTLNFKEEKSEYSFIKSISECENVKSYPSAKIIGTDYIIGENSIEVRVKVKLTAVIFETLCEKVVYDITLSDNPAKKSSSMIVYYPQNGEELWDIARKFSTTIERISKENDLEEEIITSAKPLIIWS